MSGRHRIVRVLAVGVAVVVGLTALAAAYVYVASERVIHRKYEVQLVDIDVPTDSAAVAEGRRLAAIRGCFGCHGGDLEGEVFRDDFDEGRIVAPNLTRVAHEYSTAELARAIRYGVRANGEGLQVMPSPMYYHLSDADLGRIIAFLRDAPRMEGPGYEYRPGVVVRWEMAKGEWYPWVEDILRMGPRMSVPQPGDTLALGAYLSETACTECHGADLEGDWGPDLVIAAAYSPDDFARLMRTGVAKGDRELGVMSRVARGRFSHLTDAEIRALDAFLRARATKGSRP